MPVFVASIGIGRNRRHRPRTCEPPHWARQHIWASESTVSDTLGARPPPRATLVTTKHDHCMARNSAIEWTGHTFNPWWGCTKVSPACDHCYAEVWAKRTGHSIWGADAPRRQLSNNYWNQPLRWDRAAALGGGRARVFCASMADVFESNRELDSLRARLWALVERTPNLDWLLLTKRPHLARRLAPWTRSWPRNIWLGATVENQHFADRRIRYLLDVPCQFRFLSCEPLLGPVDLSEHIGGLHWIIAGGETRRSVSAHASGLDPRAPRSVCERPRCLPFQAVGQLVPTRGLQDRPREADNVLCSDEQEERRTHLGRPDLGRTAAWILRALYSTLGRRGRDGVRQNR